jgi:nucleoside-diphosphate-sugar epimerase
LRTKDFLTVKNILVIGGTRNIGYQLVQSLLERGGYQVTMLNRGMGEDDLPESVYRLRADRTNAQQMRRALLAKSFDAVVDFVLFNGREAETILELLKGRTEHYIWISSGQVYLVREDIARPFKESDYDGRLLPAPKPNTYAYEEWQYGIDKRAAEDTFARDDSFPYTSLRLPMVNSERDPFRRLYGYILRLKDGGPLLVPEKPNYPLRHVYGLDVVNAIIRLIETGMGKRGAYNLAQDETVTIDEFLHLLAKVKGVPAPRIVRKKAKELEAGGFLPDCSPFSDVWMSELDNTLSKEALGITYTPLETYLTALVEYYRLHPPQPPVSYRRRTAEIQFANEGM